MESSLKWETPNFIKENYPLLLTFLNLLFIFYLPSLVAREDIIYFALVIVVFDVLIYGPIIRRNIELSILLIVGFKNFIGLIIGMMAMPLPFFAIPLGIAILFSFFLLMLVSSNRTHRTLATSIHLDDIEKLLDLIDNWLIENNYQFERCDNHFDLTPESYDKMYISVLNIPRFDTDYITVQLAAPLSKGKECLKPLEKGIFEIVVNSV